MSYLFTSESVSEGHPDKIADQISDALVDHFLAFDPDSKVACETLVTTGQVVLAGEVKSRTYIDAGEIARDVIRRIGYTKSEYMFEANSCGVFSAIHEQSPDINQGVDRASKEEQGAGDQGIMFGYATDETDTYMPLALELSHLLLRELAAIRKEGKVMKYLRPDAKSQVTIRYSDRNVPEAIDTVVISTQHDDFADEKPMQDRITADIKRYLIPRIKKLLPRRVQRLFTAEVRYLINPTGKFVIGGPHGDTGLTGRKIIVDTYGGKGAHGGGAFSGKDPSKVDRSAAYAARYVAKNLVAAGIAKQVLVQLAYAIGVAEPVGFYLNTYGTATVRGTDGKKLADGAISERVQKLFDLRPYGIETKFGLRSPIYSETAAYGHMGRTPQIVEKQFKRPTDKGIEVKTMKVELFTWEKLDSVDAIKKAFGL
ncbi:MAG: methionine adenosyltransferase [Schleiferiaceae bacterium]|jgi:S-adenosylmethionine synthetase|nr:methionine adenosyltransferase [Schleiferiaceae bacterium]MDP4742392.1 methionine adenosyltransferase [Schleiferiaceae bacterium]MDP4932179.1 methionine adenosyltransferase [Schleiferiaceae bacterium]